MSVIQGLGESEEEFLARPIEEGRYCDFKTQKTAANRKDVLVKIKLILGLRDPEAVDCWTGTKQNQQAVHLVLTQLI